MLITTVGSFKLVSVDYQRLLGSIKRRLRYVQKFLTVGTLTYGFVMSA